MSFIQFFFQDLYDNLSSKSNLCALKGSFVIEDTNDTILNGLKELGAESKIYELFKTHTLFNNCDKIIMYEITFTVPIVFKCYVNSNCYQVKFSICKYYNFSDLDKKYLFLKFERFPTLSFPHLVEAFKVYQMKRDDTKTITKCPNTNIPTETQTKTQTEIPTEIPTENFFYHAENREFDDKKHANLEDIFGFTRNTSYIDEKRKYNKCVDFTQFKRCKEKEKEKQECLSNDIFIPNTHVSKMKTKYDEDHQYQLPYPYSGGRKRKSRKRKSRKRKSRKRLKKTTKY